MLHFDGSLHAATKRVQKLKAGKLISERPRRPYEPSVLHLTSAGINVLRQNAILAKYPPLSSLQMEKRAKVSEITLRHELQVMDVKAAFVAAIRNAPDLHFGTLVTWPQLLEFDALKTGGQRVTVKPDGFLQFQERDQEGADSEYTFFIEVDRGTEVQDTLSTRAACYRDYYRSGGFAVRCGGARSKPQEYPFRVLFVFATAERRNNAAERMLMIPEAIGTMACLSTFDEVRADPLGRIWITPRDYQLATKGTPFEVERRKKANICIRSVEREKLVESRIQKSAIME